MEFLGSAQGAEAGDGRNVFELLDPHEMHLPGDPAPIVKLSPFAAGVGR